MAKIAIIADVHANLQALNTVVNQLKQEKPDYWVCLGDIVGYGPYPSECIEVIRSMEMICVQGNHDAGVAGLLSLKHFRDPNRKLIEITKHLLSKDDIKWLTDLPLVYENDLFIAAHASPVEPNKWKYVDSAFIVRDILSGIAQPLCFIGHTHKPTLVSDKFGINGFIPGNKYLINPGSVGQSRDEDYKASCCIIDTEEWEYKNFRLDYETEFGLTGLMKLGFTRRDALHLLKL